MAENERKYKSQEIVTKWMQEKKEKEVQRKSRIVESKRIPDSPTRKPPTIKKNVAFDQWLQKKNQEEKVQKKKIEEKQISMRLIKSVGIRCLGFHTTSGHVVLKVNRNMYHSIKVWTL